MDNPRIPAPRRRPMAEVRQLPLFKREIIERISPAGFALLLSGARRISEGKLNDDGLYYGSTMITLELSAPGPQIRAALDPSAAERMASLLSKDRKLRRRLESLGLQEATRIAGQPLTDPEVDVRITSREGRVLLDIDVEGHAQAQSTPSRARR